MWSFVRYDDEYTREGREILPTEYEEYMDDDFYETVVTRLRTVFDKETFTDSGLRWLFP